MKELSKRTWAEIDLDAIKYNFNQIKKKLEKNTKLLCVLKADAYGHGAPFLVKEYEKLGADWFGVSGVDEAVQLRESGAIKPILIFGYTPKNMVGVLGKYNISQAVFSETYAKELQKECAKKNMKIKIHIKVDTGMNRIGFLAQNKEEINISVKKILDISACKEFEIEGIFTHFSVSDNISCEKEYTLNQYNKFTEVINCLENKGLFIPVKHCCNSGGIVNFPEMHLNMVRAGLVLYGLYPSEEIKSKIDLKPVMCLKTVISQIKNIPAGADVGYGRTFTTSKNIKLATVPIGYADGYSTAFSNKGEMVVNKVKAHICGKVCMDQLMLDVSHIPGVKEGQEVLVFGGKDDLVTVDDLANVMNSINYEIICIIGKRVPRVYYKDGRVYGKLSYV